MKPIRMLPDAAQEFLDASTYYEKARKGFGRVFADEVLAAIDRIAENPGAWPRFSKRTRRYVLKRFPYVLLYRELDVEILIDTIMHTKRHPDAWLRGGKSL